MLIILGKESSQFWDKFFLLCWEKNHWCSNQNTENIGKGTVTILGSKLFSC